MAQQQVIHTLDKYRRLLETYDLKIDIHSSNPYDNFSIVDRSTGMEVSKGVMSDAEKLTMAKRLSFAKSWVKACSRMVATSSIDRNNLGYNKEQYEASFDDGAKETFDALINLLATNRNPNLNVRQIVDIVSDVTTYNNARNICVGILDRQHITHEWQLDDIHEILLKHAQELLSQASQNNNEEMGM